MPLCTESLHEVVVPMTAATVKISRARRKVNDAHAM
jgi:hypothetical protein